MKVFIPVFDMERKILEIESKEFATVFKYYIIRKRRDFGFCGPFYNNEVFLSVSDVEKYWAKYPVKSYTLEEVSELEKKQIAER